MIDSSPGMSLRRSFLALATCALFAGGCNYFESRWVLWWWVGNGGYWMAMNEFRTLEDCNRILVSGPSEGKTPQRCIPFGQVPTQPPSPQR